MNTSLEYMKELTESCARGDIEADVVLDRLEEKFGLLVLNETVAQLIAEEIPDFESAHLNFHKYPALQNKTEQLARIYCQTLAGRSQEEYPFRVFVHDLLDTSARNKVDFEKVANKDLFWTIVDFIETKINC